MTSQMYICPTSVLVAASGLQVMSPCYTRIYEVAKPFEAKSTKIQAEFKCYVSHLHVEYAATFAVSVVTCARVSSSSFQKKTLSWCFLITVMSNEQLHCMHAHQEKVGKCLYLLTDNAVWCKELDDRPAWSASSEELRAAWVKSTWLWN